jgi:hypothetical protein
MTLYVTLAVCCTLVICVVLWLNHQRQVEAQKTVRSSLEKGIELTPQMLKALGVRPLSSDLRRGVVMLCFAAGCAIWGVVDVIEDGARSSILTFLAVAAFPGLIGLALIAFHFTDRDR